MSLPCSSCSAMLHAELQGQRHVVASPAQRRAPGAGCRAKATADRTAAARLCSTASPLQGGTALAARSGTSSRAAAVPRAGMQPTVASAAAPGSAGMVAVAGATGLIGTVLVRQLQAEGYTVRVLSRNPLKARGKLPYPGLQFVAPAQWAEAVCGCTAVVNLAGVLTRFCAGGCRVLLSAA